VCPTSADDPRLSHHPERLWFYTIPGCSVLEDHVHLVQARLERPIGKVISHLKARATQQLRAEQLHPVEEFADANKKVPTLWAASFWKVFIDDDAHFSSAIEYVECNPEKEGKRRQQWHFLEQARERYSLVAHRKRRGQMRSSSAIFCSTKHLHAPVSLLRAAHLITL
jgi:REP element-mobilizing transposase RayT